MLTEELPVIFPILKLQTKSILDKMNICLRKKKQTKQKPKNLSAGYLKNSENIQNL